MSKPPISRKISAIAVLAILSGGGSAIAQIVPDETLGNERSRVIPLDSPLFPVNRRAPIDLIQGGANRGTNLFHSFLRFNVAEGRIVFFDSFANTQNILARVTGREPSQILGMLGILRLPGATTNPNLFLINPNGIIFGANARLSVPGSFLATTANAVQLGSSGLFSATEPEKSNLLTVEPSAFLFSRTPGDVTVRSNTSASPGSSFPGLQVLNGRSLTLLGGNVSIEGGQLNAFGGRIEIGAITGSGVIGLNLDGSLNVPEGIDRADVVFNNNARANVSLLDQGDIGITARNIILENSELLAGIVATGGTAETQAGDIILNATGEVQLREGSGIGSTVNRDRTGNTGNLTITTNSLSMTGGSLIDLSSFGTGNAGNITIHAKDRITLIGGTQDGSGIFSNVGIGGKGNGGDLLISARTLELIDGGQIGASLEGKGNAGNITINVEDRIVISGITPKNQIGSAIFNQIERGGVGNGGNLLISANTLELLNSGQLIAYTGGKGDASNITINVKDRITINGRSPDGRFFSQIFNNVRRGGEGRGGNLVISANTLELIDGGQLVTGTRGNGDAGNVTINVKDRITISDVAQAGSAILSSVEQGGVGGRGGNIIISANTLELLDGGQINANTSGKGNAGNIFIDVKDRVTLQRGGAILSNVARVGEGNGGNIVISANALELLNGGQLIANTLGKGDAGNIFLGKENQPVRSISLSGTELSGRSSGLFTSTNSSNPGGTIQLFADQLRLSDSAVVDARTFSRGNSGAININAETIELLGGAQILAVAESSGTAGTITLNVANQLLISGTDLTYRDRLAQPGNIVTPISPESGIYTRSRARENAGSASSIFINAPRIQLDDRARIDAQSATVDGGNISIRASDRLVLRNNSQISATAGTAQASGNGGNISITASQIELNDRARIDAQSATADGGNINIRAFDRLVLRNNSQISATAGATQAPGDGGDIDISARFLIAIPKENSDITANAFQGRGGNVTIATQGGILGFESQGRSTPLSDISASSEVGISGTVTLDTPDTNNLQNSLTELSQSAIDTNALLANSCIVRNQQNGSFYITGTGGLPTNPGELSTYSTGTIQPTTAWKPGDAIVEPQGVYQLPDGQLVMSRECN